jgi:hypothetical protein
MIVCTICLLQRCNSLAKLDRAVLREKQIGIDIEFICILLFAGKVELYVHRGFDIYSGK